MGISDMLKGKADELLEQAKEEGKREAQQAEEQAKAKAQNVIDQEANALKEKLGLGGAADTASPEQQAPASGDDSQAQQAGADDQDDSTKS
ncbi:MAG: hypothetical protein ACREP6_15905 [Candidatus Binataceae bacterium]